MYQIKLIFLVIVLFMFVSLSIFAQSGGSFTIEKSVIAGGGERSSGGSFTLDGTIGESAAGMTSTGGNFNLSSGFWGSSLNNQAVIRAPFDFDGDGKTDIGIFRPAPAEWWIYRSSNGQTFALQFGASTDKLTPADFTGNSKADAAFWRHSYGNLFILCSEDSSFFAVPFGTSSDVPASGDYDSDGKFDTAVFRLSTSTLYVQRTTAGTLI